MKPSFWDRVPFGYNKDPKTEELVPMRPTPGELYELLEMAAGPHLAWNRNRQAWCFFDEALYPDRVYIELSRRGYEVSKTIARDVFVAVAVTDRSHLFKPAVDDRPRLQLVGATA